MRRFFALIIDLIITQLCFSLFTLFMTPSPSVMGQILYQLSAILIFLVYNYVIDTKYNGISIGKKNFENQNSNSFEKKRYLL